MMKSTICIVTFFCFFSNARSFCENSWKIRNVAVQTLRSDIIKLFARRKSRLVSSQQSQSIRPNSTPSPPLTITPTPESDDEINTMQPTFLNNNKLELSTGKELQEQKEILRSSIAADLNEFRQKQLSSTESNSMDDSNSDVTTDSSLWKKISDGISVVLVADLFVVLLFLAWFLVGVVLQGSQPEILRSFQGNFQSVVLPALSVLMGGSIASGVIGKVQEVIEQQSKKASASDSGSSSASTRRRKTDW